MAIYINDNGVWFPVDEPYVKSGDGWVNARGVFVRESGVWYQVFGGTEGEQILDYNTPGSYSYTVPGGVQTIQVAATGAGGSGSTIFFNAGSYGASAGNNGADTTVELPSGEEVWSVVANGGFGGNRGNGRGTVAAIGQLNTITSQTGGNNSGGRGGASFYGPGSNQGGNFVRSLVPTFGAGSGGGFPDGSSTQGGDGGGTFIGEFPVRSGEVIELTVGAGGAARTSNYTRGGDKGSYSGAGGSGRVVLTVPPPTIFTFVSETVLYSGGLAPDSANFENQIVPRFQNQLAEAFYSQGYTVGPGGDSNYRVFVKEGYRVVSSDGTFVGSTRPGRQVNFYEGRTVTGINTSHNGGTSFSIRRDNQVRLPT